MPPMPSDEERKSDPRIHITRVRCGDARTEIETFDWDDRAVLRIIGGNGWAWLDPASRLAVAAAILPAGTIPLDREPSEGRWARAIEAATVVYHRRLEEAGCPMWGAVVRAVWAVLAEGAVVVDGAVTVPSAEGT